MLVTTIAAYCFAFYFVNVFQGAMLYKRVFKINHKSRVKPFDCVQCLSVWVAVVLFFSPEIISNFIAVVFGAGFIANKVQ